MSARLIVVAAAVVLAGFTHRVHGPELATDCVSTGEVPAFTLMIRSPDEIQALWARAGHDARSNVDGRIGGFIGLNASGQTTLVLPPLRGQTDRERLAVWGHELAHIVCGHFHG